jgi:hypothetical protein
MERTSFGSDIRVGLAGAEDWVELRDNQCIVFETGRRARAERDVGAVMSVGGWNISGWDVRVARGGERGFVEVSMLESKEVQRALYHDVGLCSSRTITSVLG